MNIVKSLLALVLFGSLASAAEPDIGAASVNPYAAGNLSFSGFGSYNVRKLDGILDRFGAGAALQYQPIDNIGIEVSAISEGIDEHSFSESFNEASIAFKGYLPIKDTGLAPYGFIGYSRGFVIEDDNRMDAGAGIELRARKLFFVFLDGKWSHDFVHAGHVQFRLGLGLRGNLFGIPW